MTPGVLLADAGYGGRHRLPHRLSRLGLAYVVGIPSTTSLHHAALCIAAYVSGGRLLPPEFGNVKRSTTVRLGSVALTNVSSLTSARPMTVVNERAKRS